MNNNPRTPSHHEVGKIAKKKAIEFQPSIKRWLTKATAATQHRADTPNLGACIANTANNNNINNDTVSFENKVRKMNAEYNSKVKEFKKSDETFKMISTNVNSVQSFPKRQKIFNLLKSDPDILLMVDTRVKEIDLTSYAGNGRSILSTNTEHRGVAFLIKSGMDPEVFYVNNDSGNILAITFKMAGKIHGLVGVYGPSEDNVPFFENEVNDTIKNLINAGAKEIIVAGDLNIQLGKRIGYTDKRTRKSGSLKKIMKEHNIADHVAILANETNTSPMSFWRRNTQERANKLNETHQASRLDHVLTSLPHENVATKYLRFYPSDHALAETIIKIKSRTGQTPWRLNRYSLDDKVIEKKITVMAKKVSKNLNKAHAKNIMSSLNEKNQAEILLKIAMNKWITLTNYVKKITSGWARKQADLLKKEKIKLSQCLYNLELDNDSFNELSEEFNKYETEKYKIKTELYKFKNKFENKRLLKYRAQFNTSNRTMKKLTFEEDTFEKDTDIRKALTSHFTSTFSCDCEKNTNRCIRCVRNNCDYVKNINPPINSEKKLSGNQRADLDKPITEEEIENYVKKKLKKEGKAPGPDGIPYIFVYKFWPHLKRLINTIITKVMNNKIMPNSLPEGLVIFLPKNGKDPEKINAWRPLTMLNTIYKICSGIIASRADKIIESVIHRQQYGFVKKRQAADLVELLNHVIKEKNEENIAVVGMDFRGAFDTVKHEAIIRALKRKNFGPNFTLMVANLLVGNTSTIIVNGRMDQNEEKVKVKRSARQGDPLSPFLFILVLDELLEIINKNEKLAGTYVGDEYIKGMAYVDDNYTILADNPTHNIQNQVDELLRIMAKFKKISGLEINVSKSEILTNNPNLADEISEISGIIVKQHIISLGVKIGKNVNLFETIDSKIDNAIDSLEQKKIKLY